MSKLKVDRYKDGLDKFYHYVERNGVDEGLWISNPSFIVNSDKKAGEIIYYPLYNSSRIEELIIKIKNAEHVLINTCDLLPCPSSDSNCPEQHERFISLLSQRFSIILNATKGQCNYYIFSS